MDIFILSQRIEKLREAAEQNSLAFNASNAIALELIFSGKASVEILDVSPIASSIAVQAASNSAVSNVYIPKLNFKYEASENLESWINRDPRRLSTKNSDIRSSVPHSEIQNKLREDFPDSADFVFLVDLPDQLIGQQSISAAKSFLNAIYVASVPANVRSKAALLSELANLFPNCEPLEISRIHPAYFASDLVLFSSSKSQLAAIRQSLHSHAAPELDSLRVLQKAAASIAELENRVRDLESGLNGKASIVLRVLNRFPRIKRGLKKLRSIASGKIA